MHDPVTTSPTIRKGSTLIVLALALQCTLTSCGQGALSREVAAGSDQAPIETARPTEQAGTELAASASRASGGEAQAETADVLRGQKQFFRSKMGCAFLAHFIWEGMNGSPTSSLPELEELVLHSAVWPLDPTTSQPWRILEATSAEDRPVILARVDATRWEWTVLPTMNPEDEGHALNSSGFDIGQSTFAPKIQGLVAEAPDSYYAFAADPLTAVVSEFTIRRKRLPITPGEAFTELSYGVNANLLDKLIEEFPISEFRVSEDRQVWGLLLQRTDGSQVILAQRGKEIGAGTVMRNLGAWRDPKGVKTAEFMQQTSVWESLADFKSKVPLLPNLTKKVLAETQEVAP